MNILVTGGMGDIGRPTVTHLLARGHRVRVLDLDCSVPVPGAECIEGDICDVTTLREASRDVAGIVHLAAYRHPSLAPGQEMFRVNVGGTFNLFQVAAEVGIRRVVCASSINALGYNFGVRFPPNQLRYFPIDEDHPTYTTDPYSFSKRMVEEVGAYFWRRDAISSTFLRFPAVYNLDNAANAFFSRLVATCRRHTQAILMMTEPARSKLAREVGTLFEIKAAERAWETKFELRFPNADIIFGRSNFWTSLDVRDAAQSIEKSLLADFEGSYPLYVTSDQNFVGLPSDDLVTVFFPGDIARKKPLAGTESLVSIEKARTLIGFEPAYPFTPKD